MRVAVLENGKNISSMTISLCLGFEGFFSEFIQSGSQTTEKRSYEIPASGICRATCILENKGLGVMFAYECTLKQFVIHKEDLIADLMNSIQFRL